MSFYSEVFGFDAIDVPLFVSASFRYYKERRPLQALGMETLREMYQLAAQVCNFDWVATRAPRGSDVKIVKAHDEFGDDQFGDKVAAALRVMPKLV